MQNWQVVILAIINLSRRDSPSDKPTTFKGIKIMPSSTQERTVNSLEDIFNSDELGIFDDDYDPQGIIMTDAQYQAKYGRQTLSRKSYQPIEGEITATQKVCKNYDDYKHLIDSALHSIETINHQKTVATRKDIVIGAVVVFKGVLGVVVGINESENRRSGQSFRAHIVFSNKTESHLLLSTVVSNTYKEMSYLVRY